MRATRIGWALTLLALAAAVFVLIGWAQVAGATPEVFCKVGYHRVLKPHPAPHFVCKRDKP